MKTTTRMPPQGRNMDVKKLTKLSLLTAVALIIFVIELRLPNIVPIPGVKLGLANIVTVYTLYNYGIRDTAMICAVRIFLGSLFSGNLMAMLFGFGGSLLCILGMSLLKRAVTDKYLWLLSIFGAVFHNIGQIAVACAVMQTFAVVGYLPFLMVTGCIAGLFTGMCAQLLILRLKKR